MTDDCIHGVALDETCVLCCRTSARQYRDQRDDCKRDLEAANIEVAHLREAFVTMEQAANQRETERDLALADLDDAATAICAAFDVLGLAGIDQPITIVDAARSRMDDLAAARAVLESAEEVTYITTAPDDLMLRVDRAAWLAWQERIKNGNDL